MASNLDVISHWYQLIEGLQLQPSEYYKAVEAAVAKREIPGVKLSHVAYAEGGIMSAKREYLRVKRNEYIFDICGAPFGNGFFFSWWLGETPGCFPGLAIFSGRGRTYYSIDTAMMFQCAVQSAVNEVIDEATQSKGIRQLTELERKPILKDLS